jgi:IrrE N-terminal-like domain
MTLPTLEPAHLRLDNIDALAGSYAKEARRCLVRGEDQSQARPHFTGPLGIKQLQQIARYRGIASIDTEAHIASDGQLVPLSGGGFTLRIAGSPTNPRGRFTIAHEIAHTFFYSNFKHSRHRSSTEAQGSRGARMEERFCDSFAARLLLPDEAANDEFRDLLEIHSPQEFARKIENVGRKWGTSTRSTLIRLNETLGLPETLLVVVLKWRAHNRTGTEATCRVEAFYPRPAESWFLPSNQRASTIGLHGALALFEHWQNLRPTIRAQGGFYTLRLDDGHASIASMPTASADIPQRLNILMKPPSLPWRLTSIDFVVNYRLYATRRANPYCLAFVSVPQT